MPIVEFKNRQVVSFDIYKDMGALQIKRSIALDLIKRLPEDILDKVFNFQCINPLEDVHPEYHDLDYWERHDRLRFERRIEISAKIKVSVR